MKTKNVIEGLQILQKYRTDQEHYDLCAEHDVLHVLQPDKPISQDDRKQLVKLGWRDCVEDWQGFV